jgi:hypothetical protein
MVRRHFGRDHHPVYRALAQVLAAVVWPPAVLLQLWVIRRHGPGTVPIKQVPGALWAALRHNVGPGEYYAYGIWQPDRKVNIDNYLYSKEASRIFKLLNRPSQPNPIDDKLAFYEICKAHALPTPEILAAFTPTSQLLKFELGLPPKRDLFVKPRMGVGGDGAEHFRWDGVLFKSERCDHLRAEDLAGYLVIRTRTENRTLIVQPALSNHPELRIAATASLATARVVTGLSANGDVIPIFGHIHFLPETAAQSVALIDLASGRFAPPQRKFDSTKWSAHQIDMSSVDGGGILPDWDSALRYIEVAHQACSNFVFIGWDVAFTEQGPVLLEGNLNWDASDYQRLRGQPLGNTKFADILATRLRDLVSS